MNYIDEANEIKQSAKSQITLNDDSVEFKKFTSTKENIINFIECFIQQTISNENLKIKMLENLHDKNFHLTTSFSGNDTGGYNSAKKINGEFINYKEAWIGKQQFSKKITTDFKTIRNIVHELAHACSQKFDETRLNNNNGIKEKDQSVGEIESKFMERIFDTFLQEHSDEISKEYFSSLSSNQIIQEATNLKQYDLIDLTQKCDNSVNARIGDRQRQYEKRYVIGGVFADYLERKYKQNKTNMIDLFSDYLSINAEMDIDEISRFLSSGDFENYPQLINEFIKNNSKRIEKIDKTQVTAYYESEKTDNPNVSRNVKEHNKQNHSIQQEQGEQFGE